MKRQTLTLVLIGVILFIAGSAIAFASVKGAGKHAASGSNTTAPVSISAVVAKGTIPAGTTGQSMISNKLVAIELVPTKSFKPTDLATLAGLSNEVSTQTIAKGQAISSTELSASTSAISIPNGMDAMTVTMTGTNALAGYLQPGSRVDVYANITKLSTGDNANLPVPCTELVTSNVQVLDVESTVPSYAGHKTAAGTHDPGERDGAVGGHGPAGADPAVPRAERSPVGRPAAAGCDAAAADAVHRHRSDHGRPMISRRILVISRSPALSRAIQASLGPGYQVVTSSNVIDVEEEVREQGPFDILVAGPVFDSHAGMARLANLRAASAVPAVVLALGPKPKANLGDIVRTGAVELVEYPTSKRQLSSALKRAFDIADVSQSGAGTDAPGRH